MLNDSSTHHMDLRCSVGRCMAGVLVMSMSVVCAHTCMCACLHMW